MTEPLKTEGKYRVKTFYQFTRIDQDALPALKEELTNLGDQYGILGSLLISTEGCNATISGDPEKVEVFFEKLQAHFPGLKGQDSFCDTPPFKRWKVPVKKQIVQAQDSEIRPSQNFEGQKSPSEWDQVRALVREGKAQMIDVRNRYEVDIGTFPEAIDPETNTFKEFTDYLGRETGESLDPSLPTAIFCTGGIRCEKARFDLERHGFTDVMQLKGGILGYFRDSEEQGFEGECFVFDERVAVDNRLNPSSLYELCPTCGGPTPKDGGAHNCDNGRRSIDQR